MTAMLWSLRYEALMAARRRAVQGTLLPLLLLTLLLTATSPIVTGQSDPAAEVGAAAVLVNTLCALGTGLALTDRLRRAHDVRDTTELLAATPAPAAARSAGQFLGPLLTALGPVVLLFLLGAAVLAAATASGTVLLAATAALVTAIVPAALLAAALGGLLGALLPPAAARVALTLVWIWACQFPPAFSPVPTPTGTLLSPIGGHALVAWAHAPRIWATRDGTGALRPDATDATALLNLVLVLATAALCYALGHLVARTRRHGAS
ncbi:hypothetical protein PUR71_26430 [Streptomyces sp. SP17BM10]|uniref:hypothetical protein n=1 Tax=Streptomyces sp. SP17BM10 TaxID=3002530 RepID=UPI002E786E92|nr:hypothetical protein [Streptomyces sp. SP17BM10]MEE1786413.1 hypothetical protein [Streptomyces sp. SP17BM10]